MKSLRKNDLITGYYGHENFGDDLFCDILYSSLKMRTELNPKIVKYNAENCSSIFKGFNALSRLVSARSVTLGGGSILGLNSKFSNRGLEYLFSKMSRISYNAIGVGLLNPNGVIPNQFIKSMNYVGLRSIKEYECLSKKFNNVHYTADIAYSLKNYMSLDERESNNYIGNVGVIITSVGFIGSRNKKETMFFVRNLVASFSKDTVFNIYNFQRSRVEDKIVFEEFISCLKYFKVNFKYIEHLHTSETIISLSKNDFIISDRLHGAIISHILNIPFVLSNHHAKCYDFLIDINHPYIPKYDYILNSSLVESLMPSSGVLKGSKKEFEKISLRSIDDWMLSLT